MNKKLKNELYPNPQKGYSARKGKPVSIIIHSTNNPRGNTSYASEEKFLYETKKVGAEYLVGEDEVTEFLDPALYYSWHAGEVSHERYANHNSIAVECHYSPSDDKPFSQKARSNLTALVKSLIARFDITDPSAIETHRAVAIPHGRKSDPSWIDDADFYVWRNSLFFTEQHSTYRVSSHVATIRTAPDRQHPVALHIFEIPNIRAGVIVKGTELKGKVVTGEPVQNNNKWLWLENGSGFVSLTALEKIN